MNPAVTNSPLANALADRWWMFLVRGIAAIVFGVIALIEPKLSLFALVLLWGVYAIVNGILSLGAAVQRERAGQQWGSLVFEGIIGIAAGVVAMVWPGLTALVLLLVIASWAIVTGIAELASAIRLRKVIKGEWALALAGVLSIVLGILLFLRPGAGALAVVWVIGCYAIAFGLAMIALAFRLQRHGHEERPRIPSGRMPTPA